MGEYNVNHRYQSYRDGRRYGPYEPGTVVELDDADAEWVNRDSPGTLRSVDEPELVDVTDPVDGVTPPAEATEGETPSDADEAEPVAVDDEAAEEEADPASEPEREAAPARNRQQRGGRNRAGK